MDRHAGRIVANRFLQDFLGLQVAAIGQINVCLRHGIHIAASIELARGVGHGRAGRHFAVGGIHALSAAGTEE